MTHTANTDADHTEALLWSAPSGPLPQPPVDTKAQILPIGELNWPDAERLFLRLLNTVRPVQYAKLFGTPGQAQAGIDAYARLPLDLVHGGAGGRTYVTLQSRRVKSLTAAKIKKAVDDLLKGEWADKTAAFYYATSFDLQDKKLDAPIRAQTERLANLGITYIPWGVQEVSTQLKDHPRLVDDFFGRAWVERFCGVDAAHQLANNLPSHEVRKLRTGLHDLYQAVFLAQGGPHPIRDGESGGSFVVLDVDPNRAETGAFDTEQPQTAGDDQRAAQSPIDGHAYIASRLGARRRSFRSARQLLNTAGQAEPHSTGVLAGDEWMAAGRHRLLIGSPGAGKSSLLRFAATDLLSAQPQSTALQREHGTNLPIWLPFGFLCRHLEASEENSLVSATEAWLQSQSAAHLWPLVQGALRDDRLLLLVDGIDEWSDARSAEHALGILEAFLARTKGASILSTRPYAVDRLNWRLPWAQAQITPLTDQQRRTIAAQILRPKTEQDTVPNGRMAWGAGVESFLDQLASTPELAELSRSPLFLTLLATTWQGEPLPRQRFKIYARLVELLIEKHPQMRKRASRADRGPLTGAEATILFAAVAYRLRLQDASGLATKREMRTLIVESMTDDEVLGYEHAAARRVADDVLAMAEDEFGLVVSHGADSVGFMHRVVLDHLAGQYLATLPVTEQAKTVQERIHDPAWRDVLIALLTAQVSPHATETLLVAALHPDERPWADLDGHELLADALAADIRVTPKVQANYISRLVERVETHQAIRHRANLVAALVGLLASHTARSHLLPIMKRWLTAPRPDPTPSIWALRDLPVDDETALRHLMWGMRHPDDGVKINAAAAIAQRFGGQPAILERLIALSETGPYSATQAAAGFALGQGWAEAPETGSWINWARRQPSMPLRLIALHLLQRDNPSGDAGLLRPEERAWLVSLLRNERILSGPWPVADLVNAAAAGDTQAAEFALETLATNGRNGGDRGLAWYLACNAFAGDSRFKDWVSQELAEPGKRGLTLYNPNQIPQQWRDDPAFANSLKSYLDTKLTELGNGVERLATALPTHDAKKALLGALNSWRPYAAARTLVEEYGDDERVRAALTDRLRGDFSRAAPMAGVAIDVLGPKEGFALLVSLLRQHNPADKAEELTIIAQAIAEAWIGFTKPEQRTETDNHAVDEVLQSYDPFELAELCTSVDLYFAWHVPAVITAWPEQPAVRELASKLIYDTRHIVSGIPDKIPAAILRAYCGLTDERSREVFNKTLGLLEHLEPELREVLVFELGRSTLTAGELIDVMANWTIDPDTEVRRIAFIGLVQGIGRHQQTHDATAGLGAPTAEMEWLREQIKADLCAYGPELNERRQLAWIGMLMIDDLSLIDGMRETIGYKGQIPGVKLEVLYEGEADQILVDLIAEHWDQLRSHFGDELFTRLNTPSDRERRSADDQRHHVMTALAAVATGHPKIAEMLRIEAESDAKLRHDRHFLLWAKDENDADDSVLRAMVARIGQHEILDSVLDRESWNVPDEPFKAILAEHVIDEGAGQYIWSLEKLAAYAQLFPADEVSVTALSELESWFLASPEAREPRDWDDTFAIAFGAADPADLPAIACRAHSRIRMMDSDRHLPMLTKPLLRRLRTDSEAIEAFEAALEHPMDIREDSPIFAVSWDPIAEACTDLQPLQRIYLYASVLRQVGALPHLQASDIIEMLASSSSDTVVHDPFTNHEGPLRLAILDLEGAEHGAW